MSSYKAIDQILNRRDVSSTSSANNHADGKNAHTKTHFCIYNIAGVNKSADAGNMNVTGKKVGNNINNIGINQSGRVNRTKKSRLGATDKSKMGETDIKVKIRLPEVNKSKAGSSIMKIHKKLV